MGGAVGDLPSAWLGVAAAFPLVVWGLWRRLSVVSHGRDTLVHSRSPASPGTDQGGTP